MSRGGAAMSSATALCACSRALGAVGRGSGRSTATPSTVSTFGGKPARLLVRQRHSHSRSSHSRSSQSSEMDGATSSSLKTSEFSGAYGLGLGLGLGRRGGSANNKFLSLLANASSASDPIGYGGGGDNVGGGKGGGGSGGGGGDEAGSGAGGGSGKSNFLPQAGALWAWYNGTLESHPLVAKSITAGLLNFAADFICQVYVEKVKEVDWKRLLSFASIGLFMSGPGLHYWYGALPNIVPFKGFPGVLGRIALDQIVFTPLGMLSFFVVLCTLEGRRNDIKRKVEQDLWPTVVSNWKVWIPFQVVNFGVVPAQLQVAATGLLGVVWSIFISYKGHT